MSEKMSEVYIPVPFLVAPDKCRMIRLATTEREIYIKYHSVIVPAIKLTVIFYLKRIKLNRITVKEPKLSCLPAYLNCTFCINRFLFVICPCKHLSL